MFGELFGGSLNFNIGVDCEDISRWRKMLPKLEEGNQRKLFSESEHHYCKSHLDPAPHYAARWCAKEAVLKALSPFYELDFREIEIVNEGAGRPFCIFNDPNLLKVQQNVRISLSHSKDVAMAVAMIIF